MRLFVFFPFSTTVNIGVFVPVLFLFFSIVNRNINVSEVEKQLSLLFFFLLK